jgi:hypothetical protein
MKTIFKYILVVVMPIVLASCAYDFSEDYYNDIEIVDPGVNLILTGLSAGEAVSSSRIIEYTFTNVSSQDFEMTVLLDGQEIFTNSETSGEFYLYIDDLNDGEHTLTLSYIYPSGTGSLADVLNGEFFVGETSINFSVDMSLASPFGIESVVIEEGSIYITLNPIADFNFDEAFLIIKNEYDFLIEERPITEEDLADLEIHDNETIIYNPSYAIKVRNAFDEQTSEFLQLDTPRMIFDVEPLAYESFRLTYNAHPLYNNFDAIRFNYTYPAVGGLLHDVNTQGGETIVDRGFYFGETFTVNFKVYRDNSVIENINEQLQVGDNLPITDFEDITYVAALDKYFILDVTLANALDLHQLNAQTFEIENSQTITTLQFSGDFNALEIEPVTNNLIINLNEEAFVVNPNTLSIVSAFDENSFNSDLIGPDVFYRGDYVIFEEPWSSGNVEIFEKDTGLLKFEIDKTTNFFSAVDASYFYANGGLYQLQANDFTFVNTIQDTYNNTAAPPLERMAFNLETNTAVFGWYRNTYYLDLASNTQNRITDPDNVYEVLYTDDGRPFINSNHFSAGNRSHIYDLNTDETLIIDTFAQQAYRYLNGVIFSPNGFYLQSNLYTN